MQGENVEIKPENSNHEVNAESVKLRRVIKNTADVLNETNRILAEASHTQKWQNWFLLGLTLVIAGATIAYCSITRQSVRTLNEANRIQNEILLINKRGENLTNYLLKDEVEKMEEGPQEKPMNDKQ